jgi:hypothetical protein
MPSKKLASLIQSVPPATARTVQDIGPAAPAPKPDPALRRVAPAPAVSEELEVPLQVLVPAHIREALGIMVAKERTSLRSLILRAVRSLGIEVTEEEIKGKRGRKKGMNS